MRVKPFPEARKKKKSRSFDRPRNENPKYLSHTGLGTFTCIKGIDARGFSSLWHSPELDSL